MKSKESVELGKAYVTIKAKGTEKIENCMDKIIMKSKKINKLLEETKVLLKEIKDTKVVIEIVQGEIK